MNDVLKPRMKGTELSLPWVWIHHALSPGACNRLCISPLTSHWSWHPMSTTFRNRMLDTRNSVYVLLFITIPDYKKTRMDAVPEFQLRSWGKMGHVFLFFFTQFWSGLVWQVSDFAQGCSVSSWIQPQHNGRRLLALHCAFFLRTGFLSPFSPQC